MKYKIFLLTSVSLFVFLAGLLNRQALKASHGFCLHVIEAPLPSLQDPDPSLSFPKEVFEQPFHYLGKGAQSFVFASEDQKTVLKFFRFPSHLRRFPWAHHLFPRKNLKEHSLKRLELSFHSFFLAAQPLKDETGVLYVHLKPTSTLRQKAHLIDRSGIHYHLSLDSLAFVVQKKGVSFLPHFKKALAEGRLEECKQMLAGLANLIQRRCKYNISDLDNMDNDNYGWLDGKAIHLDIGRFQEKESLSDPQKTQEEVLRVTHPLTTLLMETAPELHDYFLNACAP